MEFVEMSAKEFRESVCKKYGSGPKNKEWDTKNNKYHAKKTIVGQKVFDSKKEAQRYTQLKHLHGSGVIKHLECQRRFNLIESFEYHGKKIRGIDYIADFTYELNGVKIAEDVKSAVTRKKPEYIIKKKLFMVKYPDWEFREEI